MAWLGFRTRSGDRDRETDRVRMEHILAVLTTQIASIERERDGLHDRYQRTADNAAFSVEAMENGDASLSLRIDDLTETMSRYTRRLKSLDRQAAELREIRDSVASLAAGSEESVPAIRAKEVGRPGQEE